MMKIIRWEKLIKEAILYVSWLTQNELGLQCHIFARFLNSHYLVLVKIDEWSDKLAVYSTLNYETMLVGISHSSCSIQHRVLLAKRFRLEF